MDSSSSNAFPDSSNKPEIAFDWAHTECLLKHRPIVPTRKLPDDCRELNSLLIDRSDASITDAEIFETFKEDAIGASFRPQRKYLQLFFPDETTADSVLKLGPYSIHGCTLPLFPPKGKVPPRLIIKLGNVPIQNREIIRKAITDAMAPHMAIIEAVP